MPDGLHMPSLLKNRAFLQIIVLLLRVLELLKLKTVEIP